MDMKFKYAIMLAIALAAPAVVYPVLLMKMLCFALFACAFNLLLGFAGLLSFGHAAFFGVAGYVFGYLLGPMGWPLEAALLAAVGGAAAIGAVMGVLAIRRQGIYFTMITLALAQLVYFACLHTPATGGEEGMQGVPRGHLLGVIGLSNDTTFYYVVLAFTAGAFALIFRIVHSPFGKVLKAVKENEPRAISLGYDVDRYKLLAFVLSAALSGLAGALQAEVLGFETLTDVHWGTSGLVLLMTLIGGVGTIDGPIIGAVLIVALQNKLDSLGNWLSVLTNIDWFRSLGESVTIVTGFLFVVCVLAFRRGIVGEGAALMRRLHDNTRCGRAQRSKLSMQEPQRR
ncbi:branched-chain amino acid ABC transporter permease [Paraburkholderia kirstenboschensis]|uniref:Branched-chain amino acid ABC transporter permease n=1 Tax=Paraburkholderia kirstenboschensis TaxID=1245436 RepID=A0ABZ0EDL8_9BURK|nr:branched-chain amino acid ABC transporter permease [Paraburkholderia kirstenboschensis]WOD14616.1 branched-chain amino acid ABC transporter permease [Paraburkholderia kirstenboschensis]